MRRAMRWMLGLALLSTGVASAVEFRQPVIGDVVVTAYYDNGGRQDYTCAAHTYAGHRGTDIAIIGRFAAQDAGRDVVAAAPGVVVRSHDGEFDRCTTGNCGGGGGFGNYVAIEHDDGKWSYYAHLRQNSVRVAVGDVLDCGDVIGQVGSSGNSTGPHLHFEVRVGGAADDPFSGQCGGPLSYWVEQGAYRDLPVSRCEVVEPPPPPPGPDLWLSERLTGPARACDFEGCDDMIRDGESGGVADAWVGESLTWAVVVENRGAGRTAAESPDDAAVELQYRVPPGFELVDYLIESDHPSYDRASWARNDAMDNAANPAPADAGDEGVLRLNGMAPNEAKRVTLTVRAVERSIGERRPQLRAWVRHVRDYYGEKEGWNDAVEVNDGQTFNGGDLRVGRRVDVFDQTRFTWLGDDAAQREGWRPCAPDAVAGLSTADGALAVAVAGARPCIESPPIAVDAAAHGGVLLRVRHGMGMQTGVLGWSTVEAPSFDGSRQVLFETPGDGGWVDLHLGPAWAGTVTRLRLWPVLGGEAGATVELDEVLLVAEAPAMPDAGVAPGDMGVADAMPMAPDGMGGMGGMGGAGGMPDGTTPDVGEPDDLPDGAGGAGGAGSEMAADDDEPTGCRATRGRGAGEGAWALVLGLWVGWRRRRARRGIRSVAVGTARGGRV